MGRLLSQIEFMGESGHQDLMMVSMVRLKEALGMYG